MGHSADLRARPCLPQLARPGEGGSSLRDVCLEELTDAECRHLLAERHLGWLALIDAQGPVTGRRIVIPSDLPVTW